MYGIDLLVEHSLVRMNPSAETPTVLGRIYDKGDCLGGDTPLFFRPKLQTKPGDLLTFIYHKLTHSDLRDQCVLI